MACQAPVSMGFSRQEYWSGLPFPSPGDLSNPGIKPRSSALQADSLPSELQGRSCLNIDQSKTMSVVGWGGRWERSLRGTGHKYTYGQFMWMYGRNHYNTVKQLSSNQKKINE